MTTEIISKCGYRCDLCLAYADNIESDDQRELLSKGWHAIFGIELDPEEIFCDGCLSETSDAVRIDEACLVRPCVMSKGLGNCSQCGDMICDKLKDRIVKFEDTQSKVGFMISEDEREKFIQPYENYDRLIRLKLEGK